MAKYTLKGDLSQKGIESLIKQVQTYQKRLLPLKCEIFIKKLGELGIKCVKTTVAQGTGDASKNLLTASRYDIDYKVGRFQGTIYLSSLPEIDQYGRVFYPHLAWEFGVGIEYNNGAPHPQAHAFGLGVGTFPDQKYAINPGYWYYRKKGVDDTVYLSLGTKAEMPMYKASLEIIGQIETTAKEVFGDGE